MAKYKVISLSVGIGNKVYKSGDVLVSKDFPEDISADALIKAGFLKAEKLSAKEKKELEAAAAKELEAAKKTEVKTETEVEDEDEELLDLDDLVGEPVFTTEDGKEVFNLEGASKKEISVELEKRGIEHDYNETKAVLFALLID